MSEEAAAKEPRVAISRSYSDDSAGRSGGLFVDRTGSKPLPLSGTRYVVPKMPFRKRVPAPANSSTILRRTGGEKSSFSDEGKHLSGDEDNVSDAWTCSNCKSKNHTRVRSACTICGAAQKAVGGAPIAVRRGRRRVVTPPQESSPPPEDPPVTAPADTNDSVQVLAWTPPASPEKSKESPVANSPPGVVIPVNPFDGLSDDDLQQHSARYARSPPDAIGRSISATSSMDSYDASSFSLPVDLDSLRQQPQQQPQKPLSHGQLRGEEPRNLSPASVETTMFSNPTGGGQAPSASHRHGLETVDSVSGNDSSQASMTQNTDEPFHPDVRAVTPFPISSMPQPAPAEHRHGEWFPVVPIREQVEPNKRDTRPLPPPLTVLPPGYRDSERRVYFGEKDDDISSNLTFGSPSVPVSNLNFEDPTSSRHNNVDYHPRHGFEDVADEPSYFPGRDNGKSEDGAVGARAPKARCWCIVLVLVGITALLLVGGLAVGYVVEEGDSSVAPREPPGAFTTASPSSSPVELFPTVQTMPPTASPIDVVPQTPTSVPVKETTVPTSAPIPVPVATPFTLALARLGQGSGVAFGEMVAVASDGRTMVATDSVGRLQLFNVSDGLSSPVTIGDAIQVDTDTVISFDINGDASILAAGLSSGQVLTYAFDQINGIWVAQDALQIVGSFTNFTAVSLSASGTLLAVGAPSGNGFSLLQVWMYDATLSQWVFGDEAVLGGVIDSLDVDLSADGSVAAVGRRTPAVSDAQNGFVTTFSIEAVGDSLLLSVSGFIATGNSATHVSLSGSGMRLAISNLASAVVGWSLFTYDVASSRWTSIPITNGSGATNQPRAVSVSLSGSGSAAVAAVDQGGVQVWQELGSGGNWTPVEVVAASSTPAQSRVSMSLDGDTVAVGRPSFSIGSLAPTGLVQVYRSKLER